MNYLEATNPDCDQLIVSNGWAIENTTMPMVVYYDPNIGSGVSYPCNIYFPNDRRLMWHTHEYNTLVNNVKSGYNESRDRL